MNRFGATKSAQVEVSVGEKGQPNHENTAGRSNYVSNPETRVRVCVLLPP